MDITLIYTIVGFGLAAYSVIANDSYKHLEHLSHLTNALNGIG